MPTKEETKLARRDAGAPPEFSALGESLAKVGANLLPGDYTDPQREEMPIAFIAVRQKDLKDERTGEIIRRAGGFRTGNATDLTFPDREELLLTILGFRPGRVYFQKLTDAQPTCRSDDMKHGSREREVLKGRTVYGICEDCFLGQWGSAEGGRQACRVNRRVFAIDWSNERPCIVTFSPSSLKGWKQYNQFVEDQARQLKDKDGNVPFIHHLIQVRAVPEYRAEPAGHYIIKWTNPVALPQKLQELMGKTRQESLTRFHEAARSQEYEAEQFVGPDEENVGGEDLAFK